MKQFSSFVLVLCMLSCTTTQKDVNMIDLSSTETPKNYSICDGNK